MIPRATKAASSSRLMRLPTHTDADSSDLSAQPDLNRPHIMGRAGRG
jgi:hypothetical protein